MNQTEIINGRKPNQRFWAVIGLVTVISLIECYSQYNIKKGNNKSIPIPIDIESESEREENNNNYITFV